MKKLFIIYLILIGAFVFYVYDYHTKETESGPWDEAGLRGEIDETYVMITFLSGIDYWKKGLKGFEDAAQALNVSVEYRGATQYDVQEQITVLEQVIAKKPAGIAITAIDPQALNETINKAVDAGIPVVLFDSGASESKAYSFLGTNNYNAGVTAAHEMARFIRKQGKVAVVTLPNQLNHQERTTGFQETMRKEYPDISVVAVKDGKGDQIISRSVAIKIIRENPDISGIFVTEANGGVGVGDAINDMNKNSVQIISFDTDKGTLDLVKNGIISATLAQGTWNMGYWSLQFLFHLHHGTHQLHDDETPLPLYMDTGISVVNRENVDEYYAK